MTKKEFLENEEPLSMIASLNPETGEVLYDTYPFESSAGFMKQFEKDFPDMIHFCFKNGAAGKALMTQFGLGEIK